MGYFDYKRNGEERNPNSPYFALLGEVDKTLARDEYYVEDNNGKIQKGRIVELYCGRNGEELYVLYNGRGKINSGYDRYGGFRKYHMYDNKEDCRDLIHFSYDDWEL